MGWKPRINDTVTPPIIVEGSAVAPGLLGTAANGSARGLQLRWLGLLHGRFRGFGHHHDT